MAATGQSWSCVGWEWDLPRFEAWQKARGGLPLLDRMVGGFLGFKPPEEPQKEMTQEQHAKRLIEQLGIALPG